MDRIKLGVIGCGVIGRAHIQAAVDLPRVEVVAVADFVPAAAESAAEMVPGVTVYGSGDELIERAAVDAVVLAMPTSARTELPKLAIRHGKHVLLEKPPAMNAEALREIAALGSDRLVACASSRFRHYESARFATRFLAEESLGPIRLVRFRGISAPSPKPEKAPPVWRLRRDLNGGGILVNWGVYDLDYLLGLLGFRLRPTTVLARTWGVPKHMAPWVAPDSDAEIHAAAFMQCEGGAAIQLERAEHTPAPAEAVWHIVGERGGLRLTMLGGDEKQIILDRIDDKEGLVSETIWSGQEPWNTLHAGPIGNLADAILDGSKVATGLAEAIQLQEVLDAINASSDQGRPITMTDTSS
ncbi:MAG: Gfo/Idh/MocA family oxidoreductase [Planctomycetota bacterium]